MYMYIYICTYAHTHKHTAFDGAARATVKPQPLYSPRIPSVLYVCFNTLICDMCRVN